MNNNLVNRWLEVTKDLLKENPELKNTTLQQLIDASHVLKVKTPKKVDHIGIAVRSIEKTLPLYLENLKLELLAIEEVPSQRVRVAFLKIGESKLELLEPMSEDSSIAKFIENRGEGVHHVALAVDDINERLSELKEKGLRLINEEPVQGAAGALVGFVHPKATHGVLFEYCEKK